MKKVFLLIVGISIAISLISQNRIVRPVEIDSVLDNPGIGFTTFQRFNGDALNKTWSTDDCLDSISLNKYYSKKKTNENYRYPQSQIAYFRIMWRLIEPEKGVIRFGLIDSLLEIAHLREQSLMLRIAPYKQYDGASLPKWVIKEMIEKGEYDSNTWANNPNSDVYTTYFSKLIRALGERFDGNPNLISVDVAIIGNAGEGVGTNYLTQEHRKSIVEAYKSSFKTTQLIMMCRLDEPAKNVFFDFGGTNVGWRLDCLGDVGFEFSKDFSHMFDYYPQAINQGLQKVWKRNPVLFEACWDINFWRRKGYDIDYIISQSLKWHISSFNNKSMAIPAEWNQKINYWLKKMGYRFVLRRLTFPEGVRKGEIISITSWWENKGVAPIYDNRYKLAIKFICKDTSFLRVTDADLTKWLPGDNLFNGNIYIPFDVPSGKYVIQIGIIDQIRREAAVKLAIKGRTNDGWYNMGDINIED